MYLPSSISDSDIVWSSVDENVLTIDEFGKITPKSVGYTSVKATLKEDSNYCVTVGITVVDDLSIIDDALQFIIDANCKTVIAKAITVTGYQFIYSHKLFGSVSNFGFFKHIVDESIQTPEGASNRPGDVYPKYYVTVHDTASSAADADAKNMQSMFKMVAVELAGIIQLVILVFIIKFLIMKEHIMLVTEKESTSYLILV